MRRMCKDSCTLRREKKERTIINNQKKGNNHNDFLLSNRSFIVSPNSLPPRGCFHLFFQLGKERKNPRRILLEDLSNTKKKKIKTVMIKMTEKNKYQIVISKKQIIEFLEEHTVKKFTNEELHELVEFIKTDITDFLHENIESFLFDKGIETEE